MEKGKFQLARDKPPSLIGLVAACGGPTPAGLRPLRRSRGMWSVLFGEIWERCGRRREPRVGVG